MVSRLSNSDSRRLVSLDEPQLVNRMGIKGVESDLRRKELRAVLREIVGMELSLRPAELELRQMVLSARTGADPFVFTGELDNEIWRERQDVVDLGCV